MDLGVSAFRGANRIKGRRRCAKAVTHTSPGRGPLPLGEHPGPALALLVGGAPEGDEHGVVGPEEGVLAEFLQGGQATKNLVDLAVGVTAEKIGIVMGHGCLLSETAGLV